MTEKSIFEKFLFAGHGRCFALLKKHEEEYRDLILYSCLHDISFDLQCEGTRSRFVYNLVLNYPNIDDFVKLTIQKFLTEEVNTDWYLCNHLVDLLELFAFNSHDKHAVQALKEKYQQMYRIIMTRRHSLYLDELLQNFEYLSACLAQHLENSQSLQIVQEIGAYFLKKKHVPDRDLYFRFEYFWFWVKKTRPDLCKQLEISAETSKEIRRFQRIMTNPPEWKKTNSIRRKVKANPTPEQNNSEQERLSALEILQHHLDIDALVKLLHCYQKQDKEILLKRLYQVEIDREDTSHWHYLVMELLNCLGENPDIPDEAVLWIYENSLCSCCRSYVLDAMKSRNLVTNAIIQECQFDANEEIRIFLGSSHD